MADAAMGSAQVQDGAAGAAKAAGVARPMGLPAVMVFSIASLGLTYAGGYAYSTLAGAWPGASLLVMLSTAGVVGMIFAYLYAAMGALAPRYGADYVVASRVLPPVLAFASSWTLVIFFGLLGGAILTGLVQDTLPAFARVYAAVSGGGQMIAQVAWAISPRGSATLGTFAVVLVFLLLILPPRVTRQVLLVGVILAVLAWGVIYIQVGSLSPIDFVKSWNAQSPVAFHSTLDLARAEGMTPDATLGRSILAGLSAAFLLIYGFFNPALFAPEVREPQKNLLRGSWLALLVAWVVLGLGWLLLRSVIPAEWQSAMSYLAHTPGYENQVSAWVVAYGQAAGPSLFMVVLTGILWAFAVLVTAYAFLYTASREMIAWCRDRLISLAIGRFHPALHAPLIAVLLVCFLAEVAVVDAALNGSPLLRYNALFLMAGVLVIPLVGLALLPFRKPDWFASAPRLARLGVGPVPVVSFLSAAGLAYLAWVMVTSERISMAGGAGARTALLFTGLLASGVGLFYVRRTYLRSIQHEEIGERWKTLPEE